MSGVGFVLGQREVQDVAIEGGNAVEARVAVDEFLDELAFLFGGRGEIVIERFAEPGVGLKFVGLENHAIPGEAMGDCVHAGTLLPGWGDGAGRFFGVDGVDDAADCGFHFGLSVAVAGDGAVAVKSQVPDFDGNRNLQVV